MPNVHRIVANISTVCALLGAPAWSAAQTAGDLFDRSALHDLRLFINSRDLVQLRATYAENRFYPADLLWRGIRVRNVGVRSRGAGSRNPVKLGLLIDVDYYTTGQRFLGLSGLVLDNLWQDPAMIREYLAMGFFNRMGHPAPRESFARLYFNNSYQGVYAIVEDIDASFMERVVGESQGTLFEFHWTFPFYGEDLGDDLDAYKALFEPRTHLFDPDAVLWGPIHDLWQAVNDPDEAVWRDRVGRYMDLEQFVTQAAIENYIADNDGLVGYAGMNNFYLYRDAGSERHRVLPWDKDSAFLQSDFALLQGAASNQLMRRALSDADLRARYEGVLAACAEVDRTESWMATRIDEAAAVITDWAHRDPLKPVSNEVFDVALDALRAFAERRSAYVASELSRMRGGSVFANPAGRSSRSGNHHAEPRGLTVESVR